MAVLLGCLIALLGVEGTLRAYHAFKLWQERSELPPEAERVLVPSPDAELVYELNPHWDNGQFSVNSHGMADRELTEIPVTALRLAFLGDSITCNFGLVPREQSYVERLRRRLGESRPATTLNLGVNGYGIRQIARRAERTIPGLNPDVVVVQLCLNDPYPSDVVPYVREAPPMRPALWAFIQRRVDPPGFWAHSWVIRTFDEGATHRMESGLRRIARVRRDDTLVVLFPYLYRPAYERFGFDRYHEIYREAAEKAGLPFLDLKQAFDDAGLLVENWPIDALHPDEAGHALAADLILEELDRRGLLAETAPAALREVQ